MPNLPNSYKQNSYSFYASNKKKFIFTSRFCSAENKIHLVPNTIITTPLIVHSEFHAYLCSWRMNGWHKWFRSYPRRQTNRWATLLSISTMFQPSLTMWSHSTESWTPTYEAKSTVSVVHTALAWEKHWL